MRMNVADLIAELEGLPEDAEVRLAIQPSYPFEHSVSQVAEYEQEDGKVIVYIGEGSQLGYLSRAAGEAVWGG